MATDTENEWLVTGDSDGTIKVWGISEYCVEPAEQIVTTPPRMSPQRVNHLSCFVFIEWIMLLDKPSTTHTTKSSAQEDFVWTCDHWW